MSNIRKAADARPTDCTRAFLRSEDGGATIWNLTWLLGFVIMAGVSIDSTNGWRNKTIMQSTADAAALAAAFDLPDETAVQLAANDYTGKNMSAANYGDVLDENVDVVLGHWDTSAGVTPYASRWTPADEEGVVPGALEVNAVQVTLRRTQASGNPVGTQILHVIGLSAWDVQTTAIALRMHDEDCWNNGFITEGAFIAQSNNEWLDGLCIHGEERVEFGSDNYGHDDVLISTYDKYASDAIKMGSSGTGIFEGSLSDFREDHVDSQSLLPPLPDKIPEFFTTLSAIPAGSYSGFNISDYLGADMAMNFDVTNVVKSSSDITVSGVPTPGTMYISTGGKVTFTNLSVGAVLSNVVAVAANSVVVSASNATVRNAFLLGRDDTVDFGSQMKVGDAEYCDSKDGYVRAFAGTSLKIQGDAGINGFQGVSGDYVYIASNAASNAGIAIQAKGKVEPQSNGSFGGCAAHFVPTEKFTTRLVL